MQLITNFGIFEGSVAESSISEIGLNASSWGRETSIFKFSYLFATYDLVALEYSTVFYKIELKFIFGVSLKNIIIDMAYNFISLFLFLPIYI